MIGIIDSGIGGKGIKKEIKRLLPNVQTTYLADQKNFPYGTKRVSELNKILEKNVRTLIKKGAKLIVLACNSATVSSIRYLRKKFDLPIIGVEPAIKVAAQMTKTKNIAVFSTPITSKSEATNHLIKKYCGSIKVYKIPFSDLASHIENHQPLHTYEVCKKVWRKYQDENINVVVLACTHYTLIRDQIQKILGPKVKLVDSNLAVARRVKKVWQVLTST